MSDCQHTVEQYFNYALYKKQNVSKKASFLLGKIAH